MLWGGLHYTSIELIFPPNAGVMQAHEKAPAAEATGATLHNRTLAGALARRPPPAARRPPPAARRPPPAARRPPPAARRPPPAARGSLELGPQGTARRLFLF